jgi:copper chaperone CopZ
MTHTYTIKGMTCDGCRSKVEKILNAVEGIEVKVSLNKPIATITMEKHIPVTQLQEALSTFGKYIIEVTNGKTPQQVTTNEVQQNLVVLRIPTAIKGKSMFLLMQLANIIVQCIVKAKKSITKQETVPYAVWI